MTTRADASVLISVRIAAALGQAGLLVLVANQTAIGEFGAYSVAISLGVVANALLGLGLNTWLLRLQAEGLGSLTLPVAITGMTLSVVAALLSGSIAGIISGDVAWYVLAAALATGSDGINLIVQNVLFGEGRPRKATLSLLLSRLAPIILAILAISTQSSVFQGLTYGYAGAIILSITMLGKRKWPGWSSGKVLRGGLDYWKAGIWGMVQQFDVLIVGSLIGRAPAGAYAAGFRLSSPIHIVTTALNSLFVPSLSAETDSATRHRQGRKLVIAGAAYAAAILVAAPATAWIAPWLLGEQYSQYRWLFPIFFVNSALSVVNQLQMTRLFAEGAAGAVARSSMTSTVVGLSFIFVAAWQSTVYVAATGTVLIQIILMSMLFLQWQVSTRKAIPNVI